MEQNGIVYLVGAGPGDAGLLTLRGAELLARADVVIYDALVNPDLLRLAPREAEVIYGGKRAGDHALTQEQLNELLVAKAREGKCVVRLKGGDPYLFGRGAEEAEELEKAGIAFEVVPGISSIVAAPNYAGIPITHREHNSVVTVFTGHEDPNKSKSSLDYRRIAEMPGTKIIVMGTERIRQIADSLMQHGMAKDIPVGIVRWGTTGRQQSIEGTLSTIGDIAAEKEFTAPAITVIGDVVKLRDKLNWFEHRPLFGQRIVVTRTREQASQLSRHLLELGAEVLEIPTIKIVPPDNKQHLMDALLGLGEYDWIVFTSPNAVEFFFEEFFRQYPDIRTLGFMKIAAMASVFRIPIATHNVGGIHLTMSCIHVGLSIMDFLTSEAAMGGANGGVLALAKNPPVVKNGMAARPDGPGLGVELNEEVFRQRAAGRGGAGQFQDWI